MYNVHHEVTEHGILYDNHDPLILDLMNSSSEFEQGVGIRLAANEYGATTSRPRRVGWTDAIAARYACNINGQLHLVLTKPDSVSGIERFAVSYGYKLDGKTSSTFSRDLNKQRQFKPVNIYYEGYGDIRGIKKFDALPASLRKAISDISEFTGTQVSIVSTGPERDQTIIV